MSEIRVGLITVMAEDNTWPQHFIEKFRRNHAEAKAALTGLGFDVVAVSDGLPDVPPDGRAGGRTEERRHRRAGALRPRLVLFQQRRRRGTGCPDVPVIVWSDAHPDQNGIVGAAIIRGGLDEVGVKTELIHGLNR